MSDDNDDDAMPLHSDDLSSSDIEEDAQAWQYEDEEVSHYPVSSWHTRRINF